MGCIAGGSNGLTDLMRTLPRDSGRSWHTENVKPGKVCVCEPAMSEDSVATWWKTLDGRAHQSAAPVNPQLVAWELSPRLPDRAIITSDSGSCANWFARDLKMRRGMMASLSGGLATMGPGVPYAIAAKFVHPERPVIAMVGDGAMQMNGINGLVTAAKYWREWSDPTLVIMVLNNGDLNQVTWEQRAMEGDPKFAGSQDVPQFPYAGYAELLGLKGTRVERPEDIGPAWDAALTAGRPAVLGMVTDPNVPPLPPHITKKQAKAYLEALVKGDPDAIEVVKSSARQIWAKVRA